MEVKNLFDPVPYSEIISRLHRLTPESRALWGKMNVSQMLAHCKRAFRVPLSSEPLPRMFAGRLIGWAIKHKLYDNHPYRKSLPTAPDFIVKDQREFEKEKMELLELVKQFQTNPGNVGRFPHPFFGSFTHEQWGLSMWKHLDHHLRQFGV